MLSTLHIENIAVIERATIDFEMGFNVLTGETGAGKSIIIDSIGAILGFRTGKEILRHGAKKGFVSAVFTDISKRLMDEIENLGLSNEDDDSTLYIQREISETGKNVCRVNMKPVNVSVLKKLSQYLINIHGQHDGGMLLNPEFHINFLDDYANNKQILSEYFDVYSTLISIKRTIKTAEKTENERVFTINRLKEEIEELYKADIKPFEEKELLKSKKRLDSMAKISKALNVAKEMLYGNEEFDGAFNAVSNATKQIESISDISPEYKELFHKLESLKYNVEDIATDVSKYEGELEFSDVNPEFIESRLDTIYKLKTKYSKTSDELITYAIECENELNKLMSIDENKEKLMEDYREKLLVARELSKKITDRRFKAARDLEQEIVKSLSGLDMNKISFKIDIETVHTLSAKGSDKIEFKISTNEGETLKPLSKIASGGELSRIMLAIKGVLSENDMVDTLIFDEIDSGVSGRAAQKIGYRMWEISNIRQVLCVTHLAQIAACADRQFLIEKNSEDGRTFTNITSLDETMRKNELARIIAGDNVTETAIKTAEELIEISRQFKKKYDR